MAIKSRFLSGGGAVRVHHAGGAITWTMWQPRIVVEAIRLVFFHESFDGKRREQVAGTTIYDYQASRNSKEAEQLPTWEPAHDALLIRRISLQFVPGRISGVCSVSELILGFFHSYGSPPAPATPPTSGGGYYVVLGA